jgi:delta-aminolevulinic acid dehydratase/porphobilinogen synthase
MDALSGIKRATSLSLAVFISFAFCEERGNQRRAVAQMPSNHRHPSKKKKEKISSSFFLCVCG